MKPRISRCYLFRGSPWRGVGRVWRCKSVDASGVGDTPAAAYRAWWKAMVPVWLDEAGV